MRAARTSRDVAARQILRFGKRLGREIYVASEASATPLASYAPQSNFSHPWRVALEGTEVLSSPRFPLPPRPVPRPFASTPDRQFVLVAIGFAPPLDRALQRVQRRHQPPRRGVDIHCRSLGIAKAVGGTINHADSADLP